MEHRTLELNLASAKDLKDLNIFSKMDVYAVLSLSGDQKTKTPVDRNGGTNPTWNFPVKFTFDESEARQNRLAIEIKIRSERALATDKDIGQVHVPLMELLKQPGDGKSFQHVSYQVRKPSGKPKGALNFSYKFGDKFTAPAKVSAPAPASVSHKVEPLTAYPTPAMGSTSSAAYPAVYPPPPPQYAYPPPPPQPAHGYGYAPQHGYGYAPQAAYGYAPQAAYGYAPQPGYGYAPPPPAAAVQRPGKNNFGMGLGAGLLGGALGGLLIGDMISDAGSYDAGFGDVGGFDF